MVVQIRWYMKYNFVSFQMLVWLPMRHAFVSELVTVRPQFPAISFVQNRLQSTVAYGLRFKSRKRKVGKLGVDELETSRQPTNKLL